MRFHPKSRASSDQRPGPNIASAPADGRCHEGREDVLRREDVGKLNRGYGQSSQRRPQPGDK